MNESYTEKKKRIVWVGFHEEGVNALNMILERGYNICAILSLPKHFESKKSGYADYLPIAEKYDIPFYTVENINDETSIELIKSFDPDLICVIGWGQILRKEVLSLAKDFVVGAHASLLPEFKGSAPINWAIIHGLSKTGNTLIELDVEVDSGAILEQREFEISLYDSCKTLYEKVSRTNLEMLESFLEKYHKGNVTKIAQQSSDNEVILPRRRPKDGLINWKKTSIEIYNFIRALTKPYPGAFHFIDGKQVIIWKASFQESLQVGNPGTIIGKRYSFVPEACSVSVQTGAGVLDIHEIEIEGEGVYLGSSLHERLGKVEKFDE